MEDYRVSYSTICPLLQWLKLFPGLVSVTCCIIWFQLWSLDNFLPIQLFTCHEDGVNTVWLHNDLFLSGSDDQEIKVITQLNLFWIIPSMKVVSMITCIAII